MALSRAFLKGMNLTDEQVSAIIEAHTETVDGLKAQRDAYKKDADTLKDVQKELDDLKADGGDWENKYNSEHKAFEDYKSTIDAKAAKDKKIEAYKGLLKDAGVNEKMFASIIKVTDVDTLEMDGDKFADSVGENIKTEWADFIVNTTVNGVNTQTPPKNSDRKMTREEIRNIKDPAERQKAIQDNIELFE